MEASTRASKAQLTVTLLVGALVGFGAGYFAGGGGRPAGTAASAARGPSGDRLTELTLALDRDPENPELLMEVGNLYYDRGDWDHAVTFYEKARRKAPKNANLLSDLGAAHRNRGEFELAEAFFQKARESDPNHWQALLNWTLLEAYDRRDAKAAQRLFDEVKQRYPDIPQLDKIQDQIASISKRT